MTFNDTIFKKETLEIGGLVGKKYGKTVTTSLIIAEKFGAFHKTVLEEIEKILHCHPSLSQYMFFKKEEENKNAIYDNFYYITYDGIILLISEIVGRYALKTKLEFIEEFNSVKNKYGL